MPFKKPAIVDRTIQVMNRFFETKKQDLGKLNIAKKGESTVEIEGNIVRITPLNRMDNRTLTYRFSELPLEVRQQILMAQKEPKLKPIKEVNSTTPALFSEKITVKKINLPGKKSLVDATYYPDGVVVFEYDEKKQKNKSRKIKTSLSWNQLPAEVQKVLLGHLKIEKERLDRISPLAKKISAEAQQKKPSLISRFSNYFSLKKEPVMDMSIYSDETHLPINPRKKSFTKSTFAWKRKKASVQEKDNHAIHTKTIMVELERSDKPFFVEAEITGERGNEKVKRVVKYFEARSKYPDKGNLNPRYVADRAIIPGRKLRIDIDSELGIRKKNIIDRILDFFS